jgi:tRNA dimethylallyltransferase
MKSVIRNSTSRIPIIVGPTAVGKSDVALELALKINGEVISADSRQIYKYLDIATSKPTKEMRNKIPHHIIDIIEPDKDYNAGRFSKDAEKAIKDIFERNKQPIIVGGTGLYIRALVDGLSEELGCDEEIRDNLKKEMEKNGREALYNRLKKIDPEAAGKISVNDTQRIIRYLEIYEITGMPVSRLWKEQKLKKSDYEYKFIGLNRDRDILYDRINKRVDRFFEDGLLDEVQGLLKKGYDLNSPGMNTLGYKEVIQYLQGDFDLEEAKRLIKRNTRHYAKRQMTWFKKDTRVCWIDMGSELQITNYRLQIEKILNLGEDKGKFQITDSKLKDLY